VGIKNTGLHVSEQRKELTAGAAAVATGVTGILSHVPWPCVVEAGQAAAFGTSGSPTVQFFINRFIVGSGITTIQIGSTSALVAYGTSGVLANGLSLPAAGATTLNLQANDVLMYQTGGANSAVTGLSLKLVVRPLQELRTYFGLSGM
jgi:hypothetical protein